MNSPSSARRPRLRRRADTVAATRIVSGLLGMAMAACAGGAASADRDRWVGAQAQWQRIGAVSGGSLHGLETCGAAILARGELQSAVDLEPLAMTSSDHGTSWHDSPLAGASPLLGDYGRYWRSTRDTDGSVRVSMTDDCGASWTEVSDPSVCLGGNAPDVLWGSRDSPAMLYAEGRDSVGSVFYVCQSDDEGRSWIAGARAPGVVRATRAGRWFAAARSPAPASSAETFSRLLYSDDRGTTWQSTGLESSTNGLSLIQETATERVMYVFAALRASPAGAQSVEALWQSVDGGTTWSMLASANPDPSGAARVHALAVNRLSPERMYLSLDDGIVATIDGGRSWSFADGLPGGEVVLQFLFDPSFPGRLYGRSDMGVWAIDASPWEREPDSGAR